MNPRRPQHPAAYSVFGPGVYLPDWACAEFERQFDLHRHRIAVRGEDPAFDAILLAVREWAMKYGASSASGSDIGTSLAPPTEPTRPLKGDGCAVSEVARSAGVSSRAVRKAIAEKRLPAQLVGAAYVIARQDADAYVRNVRPRRSR